MGAIIRKIRPGDSESVARIIRTVMPEFGAGGQGFAIHDKEVDDMYGAYNQSLAAYFVCEVNGKLLGGGGIGPLLGGEAQTCELKKMYFFTGRARKRTRRKAVDQVSGRGEKNRL